MLLVYLPALIFEACLKMLNEPLRRAEHETRGDRELSANLSANLGPGRKACIQRAR